MPRARPVASAPVQVALLAVPETTPASIHGLFELFSAVGTAWEVATGQKHVVRLMQPRIVAARAGTFDSPVGLPLVAQAALADVPAADVVVVTDLALGDVRDLRARWIEERRWLAAQHARGALVCSVCTGAVLLAEAGLLNTREATTHWSITDLFRDAYPTVRLRCDLVVCDAGPQARVVTGGGAASWEDLALHLIARYAGPDEAVRMARLFLLGDRGEGQLPYAMSLMRRAHGDALVRRCEDWVAQHLREPNPVARMVALSGLPERTFKRRFKQATGHAPVAYVQACRIEQARLLLEQGADPVDDIAWQVGYEDVAFFRRLFRRLTGVAPARYRQRMQSVVQGGLTD